MTRESFPAGVAEQLKWYVYRLIDPRNGETFYVGKGKGNRIFFHAKGDLTGTIAEDTGASDDEDKEDASDLKIKRINEIKSVGLEVGHVIHRHGIEREEIAYEVEGRFNRRLSRVDQSCVGTWFGVITVRGTSKKLSASTPLRNSTSRNP